MNPNGGKQEPADPEDTVRMLDLELIRLRAARQQGGAPYRKVRAASFIFLFVMLLGALLALYYFFYLGGADEMRARNSPQSSPSEAISGTP